MNNEEKILNMIEKMNDNFNEKFGNIENELKENKEAIYNINDKVVSLDGKVGSLDNKVSSLDDKVGSLDNKVSSLDDKVGNLDNKVDNIGDKLDDLEAKNAERHLGIIKKMNEMKSTISRIEINTAENWRDIAKLKSIK